MPELYPLRFAPLFRRYVWGGTRLGRLLNKPVGSEPQCAESWELVDRGEDQSRVLYGTLAGASLGELLRTHGAELLGKHHPQPRFPLLFKLLDAEQMLSVQVHPNDAQAALMDPADFGKTEAWVVLAAEPGSRIYAGLKSGIDRNRLEQALASGECAECLHTIHPEVGDCLFLPAGTVHALGAGLLVAEVQQSSDITFRLFDWNRVDASGKSRPLHIEQAFEVIDLSRGPITVQQPQTTPEPFRSELVRCDYFVLDRLEIDGPVSIGGDDRFHLLLAIEGSISVAGDPCGEPLIPGASMLLPAALGPSQVIPSGRAKLLDVYLP